MHPNADQITRFYTAFAAGDHATMAACYADDATFSDPVFPNLDAEGVRAMWRMFCTSGNEISVMFQGIDCDDARGKAHWEALYKFHRTGREVLNKIDARFEFRDGEITRHVDDFDFYRWTKMALGPVGIALGWTPIVKKQVRAQAAAQLQRFRSSES